MIRRIFFASLIVFLIVGATAQAPLPRDVREIVERAIAGEREAIARYEAFAVRAESDGYLGVAALFRAQARAETTHLNRFTRILTTRSLPVPAALPVSVEAGQTADNLRASVAAETGERDGIYADAIRVCERHGAGDIRQIFDQTRDTEVEHANLCTAAVRQLSAMKEPKTFYVCRHCGYTTDVRLGMCALCRGRDVQSVN
ncbi:MAG TPA: ferritin family protein [Thermoanaerobaculia bacterium]|nr:ferritin family protein [Thermoanaerobaculia bacterium]